MMDRRAFLHRCGAAALVAATQGLRDGAHAQESGAAVEAWTRTVCDLCGLDERLPREVGN
ncbi:MAG: hypothetical protein R3E12_09120 [Candidatus Eisenbacteria bacterium]